jgi:branched-chain amino acid transport system permease protein
MLDRILSHDRPRSRWLALALIVVVVGLAVAPFLFPGAKACRVAAKMLVFILLVASFDLLLGYTGIVSFAHTMFFGIGAYGVAIASTRMGPGFGAVRWARLWRWGVAGAVAADRPVLAAREGDLLRHDHAGRGHRVPDPGLAAVRLHRRRGRPDLQEPRCAEPVVRALRQPGARRHVDGKIFTYYLLFVCVALLFLALLRIVNSPFGRVLQAIRENDFRAEAIGFRTVVYRTWSNVLSALFATLAGALLALWLRYVGPDTTLSFEIMLDILLIVVIGGMGTMYGAVVGAALFVLAQNYLQDLLKLGASALEGVPVLSQLVSPDRWLLWLGVLFVLSVYHFPTGIVGRLRALALRHP